MKTLSDVKKVVRKCENANNRLVMQLGELSHVASEYLCFDVKADVCSGGEIEFRPVTNATIDSTDDFVCWPLEDLPLIKKEYEQKRNTKAF